MCIAVRMQLDVAIGRKSRLCRLLSSEVKTTRNPTATSSLHAHVDISLFTLLPCVSPIARESVSPYAVGYRVVVAAGSDRVPGGMYVQAH
jgi:hypothetical protein